MSDTPDSIDQLAELFSKQKKMPLGCLQAELLRKLGGMGRTAIINDCPAELFSVIARLESRGLIWYGSGKQPGSYLLRLTPLGNTQCLIRGWLKTVEECVPMSEAAEQT